MACRIAFVFFCSPLSSATDRPSRRTTTRCEPSTSSSTSDAENPSPLLQFGDEPLDLALHQRRYRGRLIEEKKFRILAQPSRQKDLLLIAARVRGSSARRWPPDMKTLHETVDELALSFPETMPHCVGPVVRRA